MLFPEQLEALDSPLRGAAEVLCPACLHCQSSIVLVLPCLVISGCILSWLVS